MVIRIYLINRLGRAPIERWPLIYPIAFPLWAVGIGSVSHWTLTTLREKLIKIGAKVVTHARRVIFQMAEVAVPRELFQSILKAIDRLRLPLSASG